MRRPPSSVGRADPTMTPPRSAQDAPPLLELTTVSLYGNQAPSTRVRVADWLSHLRVQAEELNHAELPNLRPRTVLENLFQVARAEARNVVRARKRRQLLLLSREASALSRGRVEERYLHSAEHSTYDFDDALFEDGSSAQSRYGRPARWRSSVRAADVVIAGNPYLADRADQLARDVRIIPSCVQPGDYQSKSHWRVGSTPVIVWLGSPSTEQYVEHIATELAHVCSKLGARLRIISGPRTREVPVLAPFVDRYPWSSATVSDLLSSADVAIAPLSDTPYSRGKCAYKLLQYAATGLPVVGSPVGANRAALKHFHGVTVDARDTWAEALRVVLEAPDDTRRQMGTTAISAVAKHYSFDAWEGAWRDAVGLN